MHFENVKGNARVQKQLLREFSKSPCTFINPTIGLCVQLPNFPSHFIENLILLFDKSKDNTHARFLSSLCSALCPLLSSLTPSSHLSALPSLCCYKSLCGKSLSCLCHLSNLLPLLLLSFFLSFFLLLLLLLLLCIFFLKILFMSISDVRKKF